MNNNLYCWNQPIVRGNYDFYLDGIIKAKNFKGEIDATNVMLTQGSGTSSDDTTVINLSEKIKQIDTKLQEHFKFEDVKLNDGQKLEEIVTNPTTNKIYVVLSSNGENDNYNEYVYRDGQFELIGSGSYAQLQAVNNNLKGLIDSNTTSITNLQNELENHLNDLTVHTMGLLFDEMTEYDAGSFYKSQFYIEKEIPFGFNAITMDCCLTTDDYLNAPIFGDITFSLWKARFTITRDGKTTTYDSINSNNLTTEYKSCTWNFEEEIKFQKGDDVEFDIIFAADDKVPFLKKIRTSILPNAILYTNSTYTTFESGLFPSIYIKKNVNKYVTTDNFNSTINFIIQENKETQTAFTNALTNHETDKKIHITNQERTTWNSKQNKLSFDTTPTKNSTNPCTSGGIYEAVKLRPIIPVGEKYVNDGFQIAVGNYSQAVGGYSVAIGNYAVSQEYGELCLCASREDGSVVRKIELKLIPGFEMFDDVMSGGVGEGHYVSEQPYLEIKVSDNATRNNLNSKSYDLLYWEAVKIPIKNLFDLLLSAGGTITRSDNFGTTVETE